MNNTCMASGGAQPLISVIVPVYNVEKYLSRCVDSILNQTYRNLEIILVDDGSPDGSGGICDEYAAKDARIRVIHKENGGISSARNAGLDVCTGEYICFVDSDDYILPEMYKKMLTGLLEHQADICICHWLWEYADGRQTVDLSKVDPTLFGEMTSIEFARFLYKGSYENVVVVAAWNKLYKRDFFHSLRFDGRIQEDDALHSQIFCKEFPVYVLEKQYYVYVENASSLTHQKFHEGNLRILDVLEERTHLFRKDPFIVRESKRVYCNIYIEYYFKAKEANLSIQGIQTFVRFVWDLVRTRSCNLKFCIRMMLFLVSPRLYHALLIR